MPTTGGARPFDLRDLPEPAELYRALGRHHPLDWGDRLPTRAQLAAEYGSEATRLALAALTAKVAVEPAATAEFMAALPAESRGYQLESRVKSPQSLSRKYADRLEALDDSEPNDILRYTMLTDSPDELVAATRKGVDRLGEAGWRLTSAMHSYVDGSRYKGIHAGFERPSGETVEVQFHSSESAQVKAATTAPYAIERSSSASPAERAAARAFCVGLSDSLEAPPGIAELRTVGGLSVEVRKFGDPRRTDPAEAERITTESGESVQVGNRSASRRVEGTSR